MILNPLHLRRAGLCRDIFAAPVVGRCGFVFVTIKVISLSKVLPTPDLMLELSDGRVYQVTQASRGDDMDMGETRFITVYGNPYGRDSI